MNLKFGTGGIRAIMGKGPDHLNLETIQEAALGVAAYVKSRSEEPSVAVAYDSRNHSEEFAKETARVLALKGCKAYIYPRLMPTPTLSFAVRYLKCDAGVCITASHNPKEYNGFKVYGADGCQVTSQAAAAIQMYIEKAEMKEAQEDLPFDYFLESGEIEEISDKVLKAFLAAVLKRRTQKELTSSLNVVYTPLHGAGLSCVSSILKHIGVKNLQLVKEQAKPDGSFLTCPYPNPEEREALKLGLDYCRKLEADLLIATDPDSDRIGVAVRHGEEYRQLTGNQVGILLLDYILKCRQEAGTLPEKPVIIKTIVTTSMADKIAAHYGAEVINTLTGFKYIGEQIGLLEQKGEAKRFVFGFEESCGYLIGSYVRDKDAVGAAMAVCEMADAYKSIGKTLVDVLEELYETYGHYVTELKNYTFNGAEADRRMSLIRKGLLEKPDMKMRGSKVVRYQDYQEGVEGFPKADVVKLWMENGSEVVIRPSGTEPKIKVYTERKEN